MPFRLLAPTWLVCVFAQGCADDFFIMHFTEAVGSECSRTADDAPVTLTAGTLDVVFSHEYVSAAVVRNENDESIEIESAHVRIWRGGRPQGTPFYHFESPLTATARAGDDTIIEFVAMTQLATDALLMYTLGVDDVDELTLDDLRGYRDLVTLGVELIGSGDQSGERFFPVYLCSGCLVQCWSSIDAETGEYCASDEPLEDGPCLIGQDAEIDCRLCAISHGSESCRDSFCFGQ